MLLWKVLKKYGVRRFKKNKCIMTMQKDIILIIKNIIKYIEKSLKIRR